VNSAKEIMEPVAEEEEEEEALGAYSSGGGGGSGLLHGEFAAVGDGSWMRSSWMGFMAVMTTIWNNHLSIFYKKKLARFFHFIILSAFITLQVSL
jgi:hypothetical protein